MRNSLLRAYLKGDERWVFVTVVQEREQKKPGEGGRDFIRELVPDWTPTQTQILWAVRIILGLVMLLIILELVGDYYKKTLWDWADLLIVPAVLAIGGYWFNAQQRQREQKIADERAQDEALQAYLDHIGELLLEKGLRSSVQNNEEKRAEARGLARARTLTVLRRLNPDRKTSVVLFLIDASVITGPEPIIPLFEVDLSDTKLNNTNLVAIDLHDAKLIGANLSGANLNGAQLYSAYEVADLSGADLSGASLSGANLTRAILKDADLSDADLGSADLSGANLSRANLSGAYDGFNSDGSRRLVTNEKLEEQAKSLEGATMPDGTIHP
jgi:uncharacterized protein YjbI with pentapeptide repeats